MPQRTRLLIGLVVLVLLALAVLGAEFLRRAAASPAGEVRLTLTPGSIPIFRAGKLAAAFTPTDLERLDPASFVDPEGGKSQQGWLLRDALLLYLPAESLAPDTRITVSSSSRGKSAELLWSEVADPANQVMFDLSNRGTLKLVSRLEKLDTRDEWVQDVDKIEVAGP